MSRVSAGDRRAGPVGIGGVRLLLDEDELPVLHRLTQLVAIHAPFEEQATRPAAEIEQELL